MRKKIIWSFIVATRTLIVDCILYKMFTILYTKYVPSIRMCHMWEHNSGSFQLKFSYLNSVLPRYLTVVKGEATNTQVLLITAVLGIVYNVEAQSRLHCPWNNLQQRVLRGQPGYGFNIFFNYEEGCPSGPDPVNQSCVRKGQRRDNLQFHPCCTGPSNTLPNCQQLYVYIVISNLEI